MTFNFLWQFINYSVIGVFSRLTWSNARNDRFLIFNNEKTYTISTYSHFSQHLRSKNRKAGSFRSYKTGGHYQRPFRQRPAGRGAAANVPLLLGFWPPGKRPGA